MTRQILLLLLAFALAACSAVATPAAAPPSGNGTNANPTASAGQSPSPSPEQDLARTDAQGAVEFVVTPLNLTAPGETLDFDVSMNTHSVDVSWDLAAQSVLKTDTDLEVKGLNWPVGGGHHYAGTLTFPAKTADGKSLLEGAKKVTLTIQDAAAPVRIFEWELSK
jgi:hypothetical protein